MTEQQRLTIRTELARRMGWTDIESCKDWDFSFLPSGLPPGQKEYKNIPDPFTNATDKDALVEWLAADDARWFVFIRHLIKLIDWPQSAPKAITGPTFAEVVSEVRYFMTAPYETITLAAARALGIQEAGE